MSYGPMGPRAYYLQCSQHATFMYMLIVNYTAALFQPTIAYTNPSHHPGNHACCVRAHCFVFHFSIMALRVPVHATHKFEF